MRRHRVFIAINLPSTVKDRIKAVFDGIKDELTDAGLAARFVGPENWHITLSFLGYQSDEDVLKISRAVESTTKEFNSFAVDIERVAYGPPRERYVRMVWAETDRETSERLSRVKKNLEDEIYESGVNFMRENRGFSGHITLARLGFRTAVENMPKIEELVDADFKAKTIDLMESELKRSGAEYSLLGSFPLGG